MEYWWVASIITVSHFLIDWSKLSIMGDSLASFIVDQLFYLAVIGICALSIGSNQELLLQYLDTIDIEKSLMVISAFLVVTLPSGYLVDKVTARWRAELTTTEQERGSLKNAGIWIGVLERVLVLVFVLFSEMQAIGFLIAAKSILRFSDKNEFNT
ncbi:MAG: hypothetical protein ACJATI_002657 [Halioglobus sp.]|jgi:hypothetical protein